MPTNKDLERIIDEQVEIAIGASTFPSITVETPDFNLTTLDTAFNSVVAGANTDILGADVTLTADGIVRVTVAEDTGVKFKIKVIRGGVTEKMYFNSATALTADALYVFDVPLRSGDAINFQTDAATTISMMNVDMIITMGP